MNWDIKNDKFIMEKIMERVFSYYNLGCKEFLGIKKNVTAGKLYYSKDYYAQFYTQSSNLCYDSFVFSINYGFANQIERTADGKVLDFPRAGIFIRFRSSGCAATIEIREEIRYCFTSLLNDWYTIPYWEKKQNHAGVDIAKYINLNATSNEEKIFEFIISCINELCEKIYKKHPHIFKHTHKQSVRELNSNAMTTKYKI